MNARDVPKRKKRRRGVVTHSSQSSIASGNQHSYRSFIMVRDRIVELSAVLGNVCPSPRQSRCNLANVDYNSRRSGTTFGRNLLQDVHMPMSMSKKVNNVLEEADQIRELIQLIVANVRVVKDLHNNVLSHTNPDISKELESRTFIVGQTAQRVREKLKELAKDIPKAEDMGTLEAAREGPTHMRIKILQYTTMRQMFADIMLDYNDSLLRYHDKCSSLLNQQRVLIRKPSTNNNFSDKYPEDDENEEKKNLFVDNILEDSQLARQQLSEIQTRHTEVLKLEKSIGEIRDIFLEMAYTIEKQGDQINCVEYFAGKASANLDNVRSDLTKAEKKNRRYRRRKWKIIICVSVIVIVLLLIAIYL